MARKASRGTVQPTPERADESSFWWTKVDDEKKPVNMIAAPLSACGDAESGDYPYGYKQGLKLCEHGQPNCCRPQMKTFLDLETLSSRSHTPSASLSSFPAPFNHTKRQHRQVEVDATFFSSRASTATITTVAETIDPARNTTAPGTDASRAAFQSGSSKATTLHHSALREMRRSELLHDLDLDPLDRGRSRHLERGNNYLGVFDHFPADQRPSSSRSHLQHSQRSYSPDPEMDKYQRVSSDGVPPSIANLSSTTMTKDEFDALPATIQRKYFSTFERLHIKQNQGSFHVRASSIDRPQVFPLFVSNDTDHHHQHRLSVHHQPTLPVINRDGHHRLDSLEDNFYVNLPDKIKRLHLTTEEQLVAQGGKQHKRRSLSVGAADAFTKARGRRPSLRALGVTHTSLGSTVSLIEETTPEYSSHFNDGRPATSMANSHTGDTFFETFRWLEDEDDLDLRLYLDDYHINLRQEVPVPIKDHRPSFRRHLSVSKLPFGRPSVSSPRLSTSSKGYASQSSGTKSPSIMGVEPSHNRRRSALSLINGNRQAAPSPTNAFDPAAAHYQNPEARLRLREYLGSSSKFDEALEFGFPSMEERPMKHDDSRLNLSLDFDKSRTFFDDDDDKSSICSEDASMADPESPRTPHAFDRSTPQQPTNGTAFPISDDAKPDFLQAPLSSREMTLRMTLTRPDLRAAEDQIYGWQGGSTTQNMQTRAGAKSPTDTPRGNSPKDNIERQFAAFDQENIAANENGGLKRFWKKVRRT